jgi:hypothetical protein
LTPTRRSRELGFAPKCLVAGIFILLVKNGESARSSSFAFIPTLQKGNKHLTFVPNAQTLLCRVLFGVPIAATMQRCCDYEPHWSISDHHGTSSSTLVELPRPLVTGTAPFESTNLDWAATTPGHNPKAAVAAKSVRCPTKGGDHVTDLQRLKLELPWTKRTTIPVVVLKSDAQHVDSFDLQLPSMPIASTDNTESQLVWNGYRIAAIVEDPAISHARQRHYSPQPKETAHMCMFPYNDYPPPLVNATYALDDLQRFGGVNS